MTYCVVREKEGDQRYLVLSCSTGLTYTPKIAAKANKIKVFQENDKKFIFYH